MSTFIPVKSTSLMIAFRDRAGLNFDDIVLTCEAETFFHKLPGAKYGWIDEVQEPKESECMIKNSEIIKNERGQGILFLEKFSYICVIGLLTNLNMQTKISNLIYLILAFNISTCFTLQAAERNDSIVKTNDSVSSSKKLKKTVSLTPYHRNVVKFNPTPMLLWGEVRNITLSYERLIKNNQSVALQLGFLVIPNIIDSVANIAILSDYKRQGINVSMDYRYYPQLRNKRPAPDGLYIGGYVSYYGFQFNNNIDISAIEGDNDGNLKGTWQMLNMGIELGYQFIFWKRFSLDLLLFGPSLSMLDKKLELSGNIDKADFEQIDEELAQILLDRYPVLNYLNGDEKATFSQSYVKLGAGFRYSVQIGFHF